SRGRGVAIGLPTHTQDGACRHVDLGHGPGRGLVERLQLLAKIELLHKPSAPPAYSPRLLPRRTTPTTSPSISIFCCLRSTLMGSKSSFSGSSQATGPSCR